MQFIWRPIAVGFGIALVIWGLILIVSSLVD
jgi:hypothetical protein